MKLVSKRPTVKMSKAEFQTILRFLNILKDEVFYNSDWDDLIEDFPPVSPHHDTLIEGNIYDISIID